MTNIEQEIFSLQKRILTLQGDLSIPSLITRLEKLEGGEEASIEAYTDLLARLDNYETRLRTLEEARQKQIQLNSELLKESEVKEVKTFWDLFKRK